LVLDRERKEEQKMPLSVRCEDVEMLADAFYHKGLPADMMEAFAEHIETCPANCEAYVSSYNSRLGRRLDMFRAHQEDFEVSYEVG
jgi:hypothetical protein